MNSSFLILYPLQFLYALGATLFFIVIPAKLLLPEKWLPTKAIIPIWIVLAALIAIFTASDPPENPDPYHCRETIFGLDCD
jgi:energy-coupling factor transporter transmembrane protein EcfT